ncbi:MAG: SDR family oxidoreductase [Gammaproteobacteria bacterium]|nr:SDR family oxidoreductase [Gammaproteobacteria bacterium]
MPTVLVTGASRGLGLEFARQYADDAWQVIACCRSPESADELQSLAATDNNIVIEKLDVQSHAEIDALAQKYADQPIDVLLNNAGLIGPLPYEEHVHRQHFGSTDYTVWDTVMQTNVYGPLKMAEAFVEHVAASELKIIANISSEVSSIAGFAIPAIAYASSKSALNRAMTIVASQLKDRGIIVKLFCPGYVKTRMDFSAFATVEIPESITALRGLIAQLTIEDTGTFTRYDGKALAW